MGAVGIIIGLYFGFNICTAFLLWGEREKWYKIIIAILFALSYIIAELLYTIISSAFDNFLYWRNILAIINMKRGKYDNLNESKVSTTKKLYALVIQESPGIGKTLDLIFLNGIIERNGIEISKTPYK